MRKEYDVWACFTNGRTTYKAVEVTGPVEEAKEPANAWAHLDRVEAESRRQAINYAFRRVKAGTKP